MIDSSYYKRLSEREAAIIFNLGLRKAVYILEKAESLSAADRRYMVEALKTEMLESEVFATIRVLEALSADRVHADDYGQ